MSLLNGPKVPHWIEDGFKLTESRAILKFLAREKCPAVYPNTRELERRADMVEGVLFDVWFALIRMCVQDTVQTTNSIHAT